jgi:hypothetical protein
LVEDLAHLRSAVATLTDEMQALKARQLVLEHRPAINGPLVWAAFVLSMFELGAMLHVWFH